MTRREPVFANLGALAQPLLAEPLPTRLVLTVVRTEKSLRETTRAAQPTLRLQSRAKRPELAALRRHGVRRRRSRRDNSCKSTNRRRTKLQAGPAGGPCGAGQGRDRQVPPPSPHARSDLGVHRDSPWRRATDSIPTAMGLRVCWLGARAAGICSSKRGRVAAQVFCCHEGCQPGSREDYRQRGLHLASLRRLELGRFVALREECRTFHKSGKQASCPRRSSGRSQLFLRITAP